VVLFALDLFWPPKYLEPCPRPGGRPGNTKTAYLPGDGGFVPGRMGDHENPVSQGGGGYSRVIRGATANKIAVFCIIVALLREEWHAVLTRWTARAGIPEPHEPGHIRERLKEVRATHARAKKSGPLTPPCPNHPRWRCGAPHKHGKQGKPLPAPVSGPGAWPRSNGANPKTKAVKSPVTGGPRQDTVPFLSCLEEQKLRFQGQEHSAALRVPVRLGGKS
jgi:hypothetical protein